MFHEEKYVLMSSQRLFMGKGKVNFGSHKEAYNRRNLDGATLTKAISLK